MLSDAASQRTLRGTSKQKEKKKRGLVAPIPTEIFLTEWRNDRRKGEKRERGHGVSLLKGERKTLY